jgi:protein gp37
MAQQSKIEWTESSWNPVRGCTRVSPGCGGPGKAGGCYAEVMAARFSDPGQAFHGFAEMRGGEARWTGKLALVESALSLPLSWRKPRRIFVNSMSDLFHEALPDAAIDKIFFVMSLCPQHTFQILTKRAERMRQYMDRCAARMRQAALDIAAWPLPNVWIGVSTENQSTAEERIPQLLETPAAVRFVSAEPLLGPIDFTRFFHSPIDFTTGLHWIIVGGESGPRARPMHPDWVRDIREQCAASDVPFFFKQWGQWFPRSQWEHNPHLVLPDDDLVADPVNVPHIHRFADHVIMHSVGKKRSGRILDGVLHDARPARP